MGLQRFPIGDFSGGVNLRDSPYELSPAEAQFAINWTLSQRGALNRRKGFSIFADPGANYVTLAHMRSWYPNNGNRYLFISNDVGRLGHLTTAGAFTEDFVGATKGWHMESMEDKNQNDRLWCLNGVSTPKKFTNAAVISDWTATTGSVPNGTMLRSWKQRMIVAGVSGKPQHLYWSDPNDPESWPANNFLIVSTSEDDLDPITWLEVLGDVLLIFKKNSVWAIHDPVAFSPRRLGVPGCEDRFQSAVIGGKAYFFNRRGIYSTQGINVQLESDLITPLFLANRFAVGKPLPPGIVLDPTASTLTAGATKYYKVSALTPAGETAPSTEVSAIPKDQPNQPTGVAAATTAVAVNKVFYYYKVVALAGVGGVARSVPSAEVNSYASPSSSPDLITVSWAAFTPGAQQWRVYRGTAPGAENQYIDTPFNVGVDSIIDHVDEGYVYNGSTNVSWQAGAPQAAQGARAIKVSWSAVPDATGYRVYRGTFAGGENVYFEPGNVLTFTDTGGAGTAGQPTIARDYSVIRVCASREERLYVSLPDYAYSDPSGTQQTVNLLELIPELRARERREGRPFITSGPWLFHNLGDGDVLSPMCSFRESSPAVDVLVGAINGVIGRLFDTQLDNGAGYRAQWWPGWRGIQETEQQERLRRVNVMLKGGPINCEVYGDDDDPSTPAFTGSFGPVVTVPTFRRVRPESRARYHMVMFESDIAVTTQTDIYKAELAIRGGKEH